MESLRHGGRTIKAALVLALLILAGVMLGGSGTYETAWDNSRGTFRGGSASVDTFRLLVRDADLPNDSAVTEGWVLADAAYSQINESASAEEYIRYGALDTGNATAPLFFATGGYSRRWGTVIDDDQTHPQYMAFFAFNASGLTAGHKVESAYLVINLLASAAMSFSNGYLCARLDTLVTDYAMLNSVSTQTGGAGLDAAYMEISGTKCDLTNDISWSPALSARDDAHDYGPRGAKYYPGGTIAAGETIRLDVSDPIQQALDNGLLAETGGWLIFMITGVSNTQNNLGWMFGNGVAENPCLTVETTSRRGAKAWGTGKLPVVFMLDDNHAEHQGYIQTLQDSSWAVDYLMTQVLVDAGPTAYIDADSLMAANPTGVYIVHHTATHPGLGDLSGDSLDPEIGRWFFDASEGYFSTSAPDTAGIVDYAWAGSGTYQYGIEAIEKMIAFGYRSSRASTARWTAYQGVGQTTHLSWDAPVNLYMYEADYTPFGTAGSPVSESVLRDEITDKIDDFYSSRGRAAIVLFTHTYAQNGFTGSNLEYMIGLVNSLNCVENRSIASVLDQRIGALIDPATIAESDGDGTYTKVMEISTADSSKIWASAAMHDSLVTIVGGHDSLLEMWVGPK